MTNRSGYRVRTDKKFDISVSKPFKGEFRCSQLYYLNT